MTDDVSRRLLVARDEIDAADTRAWQFWLPKAKTLRAFRALFEFTDQLNDKYEHLKEITMAQDRDLFAAIMTGLQAIGPAVDALAADRDGWKSRALAAEGAAATDEAEDAAAVAPVKELVDSLVAKLQPAAPQDQSPAPTPEEATEVVNAAPDPVADVPADPEPTDEQGGDAA